MISVEARATNSRMASIIIGRVPGWEVVVLSAGLMRARFQSRICPAEILYEVA